MFSQDLLSYWFETISNDLQGFVDIGTQPAIDVRGRTLEASWQIHDKTMRATFLLEDSGDFRWLAANNRKRTYGDFLVSEDLGNFKQLASATLRRFDKPSYLVPVRGSIVSAEKSHESADIPDILQSEISRVRNTSLGKTRIFFVKGDAGAGKTTLLQHIAKDQAAKYRRDESDYLNLYISAQGRALSNLRDAIAGETQDLKATFTHHAAAPLTRIGRLVPIIDGFDELLGSAGYGDAFGSLREFLDRLRGEGIVVVSARSSFYDTEFVTRARESDRASYEVVVVQTQGWSEDDVSAYLTRRRGTTELPEKDLQTLKELPPSDRVLLSKPFFASKFPDYVDDVHSGLFSGGLPAYLLHSFVRRESEKIVDRDGEPLLPSAGHQRFFELVAEEMWNNENRRLAGRDLALIAELVAGEEGISSDSAKQFVNKVTSYAGFELASADQFAFEHDVYFDYFLSISLRRQLMDKRGGLGFLDRGLIPIDVVEKVVEDEAARKCILDFVLPYIDDHVLHDNRRRNAATLFSGVVRIEGTTKNKEVRNLVFVGLSFQDIIFERVAFRGCELNDVNFCGTTFVECDMSSSVIYSATVSEQSKLDIKGLQPGNNLLCLRNVDTGAEIRAPRRLTEEAQRLGAKLAASGATLLYSSKAAEIIELLYRVAHKYRTTNILCIDDDQSVQRIGRSPSWPELQRLLLGTAIVTPEYRQASGPRKEFLRLRVPMDELLKFEEVANLPKGPVGAFWSEVRALT